MLREVGVGDAVDGGEICALFTQPAQAFTVAAADTDRGEELPIAMQRGEALAQQVHAAVGVVAVDHAATVAKGWQGFAWVIGAAEDKAAMVAGTGVREFVAWAADHSNLAF